MPELPEVETVCRGMTMAMEGDIISSVDIRRPNLRWPFPVKMKERISGAKVNSLTRRAKYILINLSSDETLILHLGMSGRILIDEKKKSMLDEGDNAFGKHDHVTFYMKSGTTVTFNDPRRFGAIDLIETEQCDGHWLLSKLGPEPLGNSMNVNYLFDALKHKTTSIKVALLDQKIVSGIGNIYVCEILFRVGISPKRIAKNLNMRTISRIVEEIRNVLNEAILAGGSTLRDHRQTNGDLGYFQHNFSVYNREGEPCRKEKCSGLVLRLVQAGRSSFYCTKCQK